MIVHACQQNTSAWRELRAGIPTASQFSRIYTPTGRASTSFDGYLHELLAERIMRQPIDGYTSSAMKNGHDTEEEAVQFYELQRDVDTEQCGFITNDEVTVGASPDRLVGEDGILEIKCPSAAGVHVGYLLTNKTVDKKYWPQLQGQLWITGRQFADILSYYPLMPPALVRVERNEGYIEKLAEEVMKFSRVLENMTLEFMERGLIQPKLPRVTGPVDCGELGVSIADIVSEVRKGEDFATTT